jgi:hypothetical protein
MSYLDAPRLHFRGWFQADVSTINNDIRFFQNSSFVPTYQELNQNGSWNPEGTAIFRLLDCAVTGGYLNGQNVQPDRLTVQSANHRAPGKLVDLDPQQQLVSQIWGMQVRLVDDTNQTLLESELRPVAFTNLWFRQQTGVPRDQQFAACYQSVLEGVRWGNVSGSRLLSALQTATNDDQLTIAFNLFGYARDNTIPRYTMGHIVGTIGPYLKGEPKHFTRGRQLTASFTNRLASTTSMGNIQAKVAADLNSVTVDFGNSFPIKDADSGLMDIGKVFLGVLKSNPENVQASIPADGVVMIGEVPYLTTGWYDTTAGVQTFDLTSNQDARALLPGHPLVILTPTTTSDNKVLVQESINGLYVRADNYVFRIDPGECRQIEFYADQFGSALANTTITLAVTAGFMGGPGGGATISPPARPTAAIPQINTPADAIQFPATLTTDANGFASADLVASAQGPGTPRGYISGQLYGIGYQLANQPQGYVGNLFNYISILAFSKKEVPVAPTWYRDIQQIMTQFGNLYPIMGRYVVDLGDYYAVSRQLAILKLAFSLPIGDPNHMPVTRDLGAGDRNTILKWMDTLGTDGLPRLGTPEESPAVSSPSAVDSLATESLVDLLPEQMAGKTSVILQREQRLRVIKERGE